MKGFRLKSVLLVVLLVLTSLAFAFLAVSGFYIAAFVAACCIAGEVFWLLHHQWKGFDMLKQFVWSLNYADFQTTYVSDGKGKDISPTLVDVVNDALANYGKKMKEKESQFQYFRAIADHINLSVIVFEAGGSVEWMNKAARRQTGVHSPQTLDDFAAFHPGLPAKLRGLQTGDTSVLQLMRGQDTYQILLSAISFVVLGKSLTVATMKNIRSVLEEKETEAWQKLVSVLTHEIMNSMTPIVSLADMLTGRIAPGESLPVDEQEELNQAVETIGRRSKGLVNFVENYRKVTGIPAPVFQEVNVCELLEDMTRLMREDGIELIARLPVSQLQILADRNQIEQVLINLLKNAREAVREHEHPRIEISAGVNAEGETVISVSDNGTGMSAQVMERIFIPFFTTKPAGSGIGLSLSRQIMFLHHGGLTVSSTEGEGSCFRMVFR